MPYLDQPYELFHLIKTRHIPVDMVRVGDVVLDTSIPLGEVGAVAHVTEIRRSAPTDIGPRWERRVPTYLTFVRQDLTGIDEGYVRTVLRKVGESILIIDRSCLESRPAEE